jgi:DNA-binding transcriptional regulator YiaG
VVATQEREHLAPQVDVPVVNEKTGGRVVYSPELLGLFETAGASQALVRREPAWRHLVGLNLAGISPSSASGTIEGDSASGWLGERYYIDSVETSPGFGILVRAADPNLVQVTSPSGFTRLANAETRYAVPLVERLPSATVPPVNLDPFALYRGARQSAKRASDNALDEIRRRLDKARSEHAQSSPRDVVTFLSDDLGVSQLTTARAVGVTPTAVRKWRRGETAKPPHRGQLAKFAAMSSLLMEMGLHDPAGWIDIPISDHSTVTPLDLFIGGRADLAVLLGARLADPQEALDAFDPDWRETSAPDRDYDVIALSDGSRSVVPRRSSHGA